MDIMVKNDLNQLMQQRDAGPFIAIYLNTEAVLNDLTHRRLQLKQLVTEAENQLAQHFPKTDFTSFKKQLDTLTNDNAFWLQHTGPQTGLIVNADTLRIFDLQIPTENHVSVNSMPPIRPILADRQHQFDFDLLAISETSMALYHQRQGDFVEVILPADAPSTAACTTTSSTASTAVCTTTSSTASTAVCTTTGTAASAAVCATACTTVSPAVSATASTCVSTGITAGYIALVAATAAAAASQADSHDQEERCAGFQKKLSIHD